MRKFPLLLLLATVATPAVSQSEDGRFGRHQRNGSAEQTESRPQRTTTIPRSDRTTSPQFARERIREHYQQRRQQPATIELGGDGNARHRRSGDGDISGRRGSDDGVRLRPGGDESVRVRPGGDGHAQVRGGGDESVPLRRDGDGTRRVRPATNWGVREWRGGKSPESTPATTGLATSWRERERQVRTIPETNPVAARPSTSERETLLGRHRRDYRDGDYNRWSNHWRHDRRYDWRHYRNRYGSLFRLGYYYDPFGWTYRHWSIGSYMYPSYYGSSFWLNDPWYYRLPSSYGPYRWVRYWNDTLLVNIYTGQVVDSVYGFFW